MIPIIPIIVGCGISALCMCASLKEDDACTREGYLHSFRVRGRTITAEYDRNGVFRCDDSRIQGVQIYARCLDPSPCRSDEWINGPRIDCEEAVVVTLYYPNGITRLTLVNPDTIL